MLAVVEVGDIGDGEAAELAPLRSIDGDLVRSMWVIILVACRLAPVLLEISTWILRFLIVRSFISRAAFASSCVALAYYTYLRILKTNLGGKNDIAIALAPTTYIARNANRFHVAVLLEQQT